VISVRRSEPPLEQTASRAGKASMKVVMGSSLALRCWRASWSLGWARVQSALNSGPSGQIGRRALDWRELFFNSNGRIGRRDFWFGFLVLLVVSNLLHLVLFFGTLASLALTYCWVCLFSKRLHDLHRSGWIQVVPHVINIVCGIVGVWLGAIGVVFALVNGRTGAATGALMGGVLAWAGVLLVVFGIAAVNSILFIIWLGVTDGDVAPNQYGERQHLVFERSPHPH